MSFVYVIMVYGMLHNVEATMPGSYPDQNACAAALSVTHFQFPNWGKCEALAVKPTAKAAAPVGKPMAAWHHHRKNQGCSPVPVQWPIKPIG